MSDPLDTLGSRTAPRPARGHRVLLAALAEGCVLTKSVALQLARWTRPIPAEYRGKAEEILVAAARAGVDLRGLAAICAEIRACTARPDPDGHDDPSLDRGLSLDTIFDGAGVICGDLSPGCAAMVQAVLDALSAPQGGGDLRTRPQRYHDALAEAMRRLLASDLLPQRAGQPVKALVHVSFADLCQLDADSGIQDRWIAEYRARWAAHRAANSVATGDGGAWLEGDAARQVACDAMIIPVVTGDIDPAAVEDLIDLCVGYHQLRTQAAPEPEPVPAAPVPAGSTTRHADVAAAAPEALAEMEHQILAKILQVDQAAPRRSCAATCSANPSPAPPSPRRRPDRRHPALPAAPGRPPGPALPIPRRILPLNTH